MAACPVSPVPFKEHGYVMMGVALVTSAS